MKDDTQREVYLFGSSRLGVIKLSRLDAEIPAFAKDSSQNSNLLPPQTDYIGQRHTRLFNDEHIKIATY